VEVLDLSGITSGWQHFQWVALLNKLPALRVLRMKQSQLFEVGDALQLADPTQDEHALHEVDMLLRQRGVELAPGCDYHSCSCQKPLRKR
jgi:hypothetical protein